MVNEMQNEVPVYLFTGFLGAGKTTFIQDILSDKHFNEGENTLLLLCEEGEEECTKKLINVKHLSYSIKLDMETLESNELIHNGVYDTKLIEPGIYSDLIIIPTLDNTYSYITSKNIIRDPDTNRTIVAIIYIPNDFANIINNSKEFQVKSLLLHQFIHILGFIYDSFQYFPGGLENTVKIL